MGTRWYSRPPTMESFTCRVAPRSQGRKHLVEAPAPTRPGLFKARNPYAAEMKTQYEAASALWILEIKREWKKSESGAFLHIVQLWWLNRVLGLDGVHTSPAFTGRLWTRMIASSIQRMEPRNWEGVCSDGRSECTAMVDGWHHFAADEWQQGTSDLQSR